MDSDLLINCCPDTGPQDTCHTLKTLGDTNPETPGGAIPEGYTSVHSCGPQRAAAQWVAKSQT